MQPQIFDFNGLPVQTMSTREIAQLIEKQHNHIKVSADRLAEKGVIGTPAVREFAHNGNVYTEYLLNKRDSLILVAQNCPEFTARIVDRWQELEAQAANPAAPVALTHSYTDAVAGMEVVARMLHLEGAAALGLIRKATALTAPHLLPALPVYAIDAPRHESGELVNGGGSEVTMALSTLLKQRNSKLSAVKANKLLQQLGYLEQRTRPSTSGQEVRKFWAVSEAGQKFGKNVTSPSNPKEVQPHWFERTGEELVRQLESA
jgi:hypothetical protein